MSLVLHFVFYFIFMTNNHERFTEVVPDITEYGMCIAILINSLMLFIYQHERLTDIVPDITEYGMCVAVNSLTLSRC